MLNNRNSTKKHTGYKAGVFISAVLMVAAAAVYAAAYHFNYESDMWHYQSGSYLIYTSGALYIAGILVSLLTAVSSRKFISKEKMIEHSQASIFFLYLAAFMFIGYFIASAISFSKDSSTVFDKICPIIGLLSAIPTFCTAFDTKRGSRLHCYTSFFPIFWAAFMIFSYYFDMTHMPINSPEKSITNVALSVLILFFLSETRETIGITNPTLTVFSAVSTAFITGALAISRIVLFFTDSLLYPSFIENALMLSISLYAFSKIFDIGKSISAERQIPPDSDAENSSEEKIN